MASVLAPELDAASPGTHRLEPATSSETSSYDETPYSVCAFPQTLPASVGTIATLFGMKPAAPAHCRVLELGCASGGNLIPMALIHPESSFVGVDLSSRQIADGQAMASELHLPNLELRHASILDIGDDLGRFDYILAHGVYSWVPPDVQSKIMQVCKRNLAPQGVAYISYNCYPGWHARGAIREMLLYHTKQYTDPTQRVRAARGLLALLVKSAANTGQGAYGALMRQELALLLATPDTYLLHEHLEQYNEPLYFHQFAQRAADEGLQYLGEAQITSMSASRFGAEVEHTVRQISTDLLQMEQYLDFLRNRMFRQTLLCNDEVILDHALNPHAVESLYIASCARPPSDAGDLASDQQVEYKAQGPAVLATRDPMMKSAMASLADHWPSSIGFEALYLAARSRLAPQQKGATDSEMRKQLASRLLNCYTSGLVEFWTAPSPFTSTISDRPAVSPYARLRAKHGDKVVNMKLQSIPIGKAARVALSRLDGSNDRAAIADAVSAWLRDQPRDAGKPPLTPDAAGKVAIEYVEKLLSELAQAALLVK